MGYKKPTYKWGIPWGCNPVILTFDPNFQRDIQDVQTPQGNDFEKTTKFKLIFPDIIGHTKHSEPFRLFFDDLWRVFLFVEWARRVCIKWIVVSNHEYQCDFEVIDSFSTFPF